MPQGKGTYGKQVGRPPAKHIITDKRKTEGHDRHNKRHADNPNYEHGTSKEKFDYKGDKKASPLEYAPFKMKAADYGNSPMRKNFGVGDSEMPIKTESPGKSASPAKGWLKNLGKGIKKAAGFTPVGMAAKALFGKKDQQDPSQAQDPMAAATEAAQGAAQGAEAGAAQSTMQQEMAAAGAAQAGGAEGGAIPPHGPEAHTGGAGPIGGAEQGGMKNFLIGSNKGKDPLAGGGGATGVAGSIAGGMFSDVRLKEKIERTGASASGIPIYEFNYIGSNDRYSGAMAQDLL